MFRLLWIIRSEAGSYEVECILDLKVKLLICSFDPKKFTNYVDFLISKSEHYFWTAYSLDLWVTDSFFCILYLNKKCFVWQLYTLLHFQVQLRHKLARLLGYANYAEYAVDHRMASSSTKVCPGLVQSFIAWNFHIAWNQLKFIPHIACILLNDTSIFHGQKIMWFCLSFICVFSFFMPYVFAF